jgi:transposase-like protein
MDGERDVLGMWVGPTGGDGAKFSLTVLTELRSRGIQGLLRCPLQRAQGTGRSDHE